MTTLLILAGLGAGALILSAGGTPPRPEQEGNLTLHFQEERQDLDEAGIWWGKQRAWVQNLVDLNDAWKPRSAPMQEATYSMNAVLNNQAEIDAYLKNYGPQWMVRADPQIPVTTPDQSQLNVEIPCPGVSFHGDHENFLATYPRAYADYTCGRDAYDNNWHIFTGQHDTLGMGEPTESEELNVPVTGHLNFILNPFGPGGSMQTIQSQRQEGETFWKGTHMDHVLGYPKTQIQASKLW